MIFFIFSTNMELNSRIVGSDIMDYQKRAIESVLQKAEKQTKVVLLTGSRQVGKSTVIQKVFPNYPYITLDDENELYLARTDRNLFFEGRHLPVIIDEVQYAPELFRSIKRLVDSSEKKGQVFLTGSQTYALMSNASESLAGRISIIEMSGLSMRERYHVNFNQPFIPTEEYLSERAREIHPYYNLWEDIHRGSMPELLDPERDWEWFYRDYVRTYLERDIRQIVNIRDEMKFRTFLTCLAARSGQVVVYDDIARDTGVDIKTVQHWLSVVLASGLVKLVPPYQNNVIKRAIKSPKLYFMDTGLLCYLVGWNTTASAQNGAMSGAIFETFAVSEIIKSFLNAGRDPSHIFYYRDKDKREIDLVIENGRSLYPIEIKKGATVRKDWARGLRVLDRVTDHTVERKTVLSLVERPTPVAEDVLAVPLNYV